MKLSKDFVEGIRGGLASLGNESIYDILKENDYGNFSLYNNEGTGFVINVKNKGFPDSDDISKLISKRTGVSVQKAYSVVIKIIDDIWRDNLEFFYSDLNREFDKNIVVVGRSGGYWGFDIDYFGISDFVIETDSFISDNEKEIEKFIQNNLDYDYDDDVLAMEFVDDNFYSEDVVKYFSFSKTTMKILDKFETLLFNEIKEVEKPDMWADFIIDNYFEELNEKSSIKRRKLNKFNLKEKDDELENLANEIRKSGKPLMGLTKIIDKLYPGKLHYFSFDPFPHYNIKSKKGTIIIVNKEYADADDSDIIVNSMVIGRM